MNAVTQGGSASNDTVQSCPASTYTVVLTVSISTSGGEVEVFATGALTGGGPSTWQIRRDNVSGTILQSLPPLANQSFVSMIGRDTSPASSQTYVLVVANAAGITSSVNNLRLVSLNARR